VRTRYTARKLKAARQQEAEANRQRHENWQAVLNSPQWACCCRCGQRQRVRGDLDGRWCPRCGGPLGEVGV